ncbi:MAG: tetratricopeptide repeat protein [Verrucomicrobiales bacterium]|nr:tetratricopeptide repeat protein [Verrucomicrobiales bacterium]MCP5528375.1 tetratricopeptide repeat protein [Verrucomicrobiales bacterium]
MLRACVLVPALAATGWAQQPVLRLISPSFAIVTDGAADDARQLLTELEVFRQTVSRFFNLPHEHRMTVNVYLWSDATKFEQFRPPSVPRERPLGGYHRSDGFMHALVVRLSDDPRVTRSSLFHEYTHLLTNRPFRSVPLWMTEGVADLLSTFRIEGSKFSFGHPEQADIRTLTAAGILPAAKLIEVEHDSEAYRAPAAVPQFYASAWLLSHVLTVSSHGFNAAPVRDYILQSSMTTNRIEAFRRAFGITPDEADRRARRQLEANAFPQVAAPFDGAAVAAPIQQRLAPPEIALQEGMLARLLGLDARAEELLREARSSLPGDSRPVEQLGFLRDQQGRSEEALQLIEAALALGSVSCQTHQIAARLRWNKLVAASPGGQAATSERREVLRLSERAVRLDPWQADCQALYAFVLLQVEPRNPRAAEAVARRALQLDPDLHAARLTLARALLAGGQTVAARRTIQTLMDSPLSAGLRQRVDELATRLGLDHPVQTRAPAVGR